MEPISDVTDAGSVSSTQLTAEEEAMLEEEFESFFFDSEAYDMILEDEDD